MAWLTEKQVKSMGFFSVGKDVLLSDKTSFYNCNKISIGNSVRIDDFCVLSAGQGGISLGNHIHIAIYTSLIGTGKISIADYSNISSRVSIYSSNDDYSGLMMTNPTVPSEFTGVQHEDVSIGRHVILGSGSIVLPGVTMEEGVAIGALSLVKKNCRSFGIYAGAPAKLIGTRRRDLLELEKKFVNSSCRTEI